MPTAPIFDRGMPIEVMKDFDTMLLFGRLASGCPERLIIVRLPEEKPFPVCEKGSAVLVRGYDAQMNPVLLRGRVIRSLEAECVVGELEIIPYQTQRSSVRYPLMPPANVYALDDDILSPPQLCRLLNISAGGACIVSQYAYRPEQSLCLQVELSREQDHADLYHCRVVRATPRSVGDFEYGLLFTQMDEDKRGKLMREIRAIHAEMEKKLLP